MGKRRLSVSASFLVSAPPCSCRATSGELWPSGVAQMFADTIQDAGIHRWRQAFGLRILLAGMIHAEKARQIFADKAFGPMRKPIRRTRIDLPALFHNFQISIPGDFSQCQHHSGSQNIQFSLQIRSTSQDFDTQRLVCRRSAAHRSGNIRIVETQAVFAVQGSRLVRESGFMQSDRR